MFFAMQAWYARMKIEQMRNTDESLNGEGWTILEGSTRADHSVFIRCLSRSPFTAEITDATRAASVPIVNERIMPAAFETMMMLATGDSWLIFAHSTMTAHIISLWPHDSFFSWHAG